MGDKVRAGSSGAAEGIWPVWNSAATTSAFQGFSTCFDYLPMNCSRQHFGSVGSQLLGPHAEKVWRPFSLWEPTFSQLQSPELLRQVSPKADLWRVNQFFLSPYLYNCIPMPQSLPFTLHRFLFRLKGPQDMSSPAHLSLYPLASIQGAPLSTKGSGLRDAAWGEVLGGQRWGLLATSFHLYELQFWANHFSLRLSLFLCKSMIKLPICLAQSISRFKRDNRWCIRLKILPVLLNWDHTRTV